MGRTQQGNNNAYCQDNEVSWVHWQRAGAAPAAARSARRARSAAQARNTELLKFVRMLIQFRADHPVFRRRRFFQGNALQAGHEQLGDIAWFTTAGKEMTDADWETGSARSLTVFLNGDAISERDRRGEPVRDDSFLLLFNASELDLEFALPPPHYGVLWAKVLDTTVPVIPAQDLTIVNPGDLVTVPSRSLQVLRRD
jgi:glycogen operon protein